MVAGLCEAYHWTLDEAFKLTVPQITMLNHAAWVSHERAERTYKAKREREDRQEDKDPIVTADGKRFSEVENNGENWSKLVADAGTW